MTTKRPEPFGPIMCLTPTSTCSLTVCAVVHGCGVPVSEVGGVVVGAVGACAQPLLNIVWPFVSQFCENVCPFHVNDGMMSRTSWWPMWPWKTPEADGEMTTKPEPVA